MQDLRFALRTIVAHRWFSAAIVVTLALGIGMNTTVFTLVNAVLFEPMPFPDGERLVTLATVRPATGPDTMNLSYPDLMDYRAGTTSFEMLEAAAIGSSTISEPGTPAARYRGAFVTSGLFRIVRTEPILGRGFLPGDEVPGAPLVIVIGENIWRDRYGRSPDVIGRQVRFDERPATIVGVMPASFHFPNREDLWAPLVPRENEGRRDGRTLLGIGLLKPGVTIASASTDLNVVAARLAASYPDTNEGVQVRIQTFNERFNGSEIRTVFLLLLAAVGFVLLIACANVANMMLGRSLGRRREMSIRAALGASRWRLVRQVLVESVLLSLAGGVLGLGLAAAGVAGFDMAVQNVGKPSWIVFSMNYVALGYCAAICVLSGLIFGLAPALRSSRVDLTATMKAGGRGGSAAASRLAAPLVVFQFSLAVVLLAAAGLLMRSFMVAQTQNAFIPRSEVLIARVGLPGERYPDRDAQRRFFDAAIERLGNLPGATAAAVVSSVPGSGIEFRRIELQGSPIATPSDRPSVAIVGTSPGYFDVFNLPIVDGRGFDANDGAPGREVAIVSRLFAETQWPGQRAIGRQFRLNDENDPGPWLTVVGISGDLVQAGNRTENTEVAFLPYRQREAQSMQFAVRASGDAPALAAGLRSEIQALDVDLPLDGVETMAALIKRQRWAYRVFGTVFGILALTALLMASVGLYAIVSQATTRRTREIGIRVALGATPARILRTVMRGGLLQLGIGVVAGIALAWFATGLMRPLLFGVAPTDPVVFGWSVAMLLGVGLVACAIPAWRATHMPPTQALGHEDRAS